MTTVYITVINGVKRHESLNCRKCQETDRLFVHSMSLTLAKELRFPICYICKGMGKIG